MVFFARIMGIQNFTFYQKKKYEFNYLNLKILKS